MTYMLIRVTKYLEGYCIQCFICKTVCDAQYKYVCKVTCTQCEKVFFFVLVVIADESLTYFCLYHRGFLLCGGPIKVYLLCTLSGALLRFSIR